MTCAHVVDVSLRKVPGVETVDVSLNKGLAIVKLKAGNTVSVPQLWQLLHEKGYTPKGTIVSVRGELAGKQERLRLTVTGTKDVLDLAADPKNAAAYGEAGKRVGQAVVIQGLMTPGKDLKAATPLQVNQVK
ncbi:MAG TPA: heavy metal-associated domain-containing protein [Bryobacteraceae bacterium]|nr:heavy metal-associated domain-containing protein [Bryobacteraceae bacterium]